MTKRMETRLKCKSEDVRVRVGRLCRGEWVSMKATVIVSAPIMLYIHSVCMYVYVCVCVCVCGGGNNLPDWGVFKSDNSVSILYSLTQTAG